MTPVFPQNTFRWVGLTTSVLLLLPVVTVIIISSFLLFLLLRANSSPTSAMTGNRKPVRTQLELLRHVLDLSLRHSTLTQNNSPHRFCFQWVEAQAFTDSYWPHIVPQSIYSNGIFSGWRLAHTMPAMIMRRGKAIFIRWGAVFLSSGTHTLGDTH